MLYLLLYANHLPSKGKKLTIQVTVKENNIEQALKSQPFFESVSVSLQSSKLTLISKQEIKLETLNKIVSKIGNYKIHDQIPNPLDSLKQYFESKKRLVSIHFSASSRREIFPGSK